MKLSQDLREFIELLISLKIEFVIVGAHALAWHGLPRYTKDVDFLVNTNETNADGLEKLLTEFGFGRLGLTARDFTEPNQVIQLGMEPNRIDILTGISGGEWSEAWATRELGEMDGLPVCFLGKDAYLKIKIASGRPQDIADAQRLQAIMENGSSDDS